MRKLLVLRPKAVEDIERQRDWYVDQGSWDAAMRFVDALEKSTSDLTLNPKMGRPYESANPRLADIRSSSVTGFESIRIFYADFPDRVRVIRVLHTARDIENELSND